MPASRRPFAVFTLALAAFAAFASAVHASPRATEAAEWISKKCTGSDGAIYLTADHLLVHPYFANLAAEALLEAGPSYAPVARRWMEWYFAHLNREPDRFGVVGTVYDDPGNDYDSSDSYAATLMSLAATYAERTGDLAFLRSHLDDLRLVEEAARATFRPETSLTFAKANYLVAYTMDNVEVWKGYDRFASLFLLLDLPAEATRFAETAEQLRFAIEDRLWVPRLSTYLPYDGAVSSRPDTFYPDAVAPLWPLVMGLPLDPPRKSAIWASFISRHRDWLEGTADPFAWAELAVAAVEAGDLASAQDFVAQVAESRSADPHWPWHVGEAAGLIQTLRRLCNSGAAGMRCD